MTLSIEPHSGVARGSAADRFGKRLLLINGLVLGTTALVAGLLDLAGAFLGIGPFASMLAGNSAAIGLFEAHGLALIASILLLANRNTATPAYNWAAAAVHLLLGGANLLFWPAFAANGLLTMGFITTAMHGAFVVVEIGAALARAPDMVRGPGAVFRVSAAITIVTGVGLHLSRLPLGPEYFQQHVLTPLVDGLFAIPMTTSGVAGALLWRRAILPDLWEKIAYGFVTAFMLGSVFIHAKTIFTWDTSYLNAFPVWYPLVAAVYLSLIGWFAVTRRFRARAS